MTRFINISYTHIGDLVEVYVDLKLVGHIESLDTADGFWYRTLGGNDDSVGESFEELDAAKQDLQDHPEKYGF